MAGYNWELSLDERFIPMFFCYLHTTLLTSLSEKRKKKNSRSFHSCRYSSQAQKRITYIMTKQTNTQQASSKIGKSMKGRRLTLPLLCDDDAMISSPKKHLKCSSICKHNWLAWCWRSSYRLVVWKGTKCLSNPTMLSSSSLKMKYNNQDDNALKLTPIH